MNNKFNENDKEQFIKFLNYIADNAEFEKMKTRDVISYFKMLNHMQTQILPKIESNILEVVEVVEPEKKEEDKE